MKSIKWKMNELAKDMKMANLTLNTLITFAATMHFRYFDDFNKVLLLQTNGKRKEKNFVDIDMCPLIGLQYLHTTN